jgi:RNA polymerase sigma-70 factor (sigma-E family)
MRSDSVTPKQTSADAAGSDGAPESAFEGVYTALYEPLVRLARLTSADTVPAEEIVQDAFVQLYRRWSSVREPAAYLRIAVVNGCRSWGRRRSLQGPQSQQRPPEPVLEGDALAVREALRVLSPRQRAAVVLRYFEDLPEAEIAHVLGCRPGTVKSLLSRSMTKLKGALSDD